jgi:hypothetical protein
MESSVKEKIESKALHLISTDGRHAIVYRNRVQEMLDAGWTKAEPSSEMTEIMDAYNALMVKVYGLFAKSIGIDIDTSEDTDMKELSDRISEEIANLRSQGVDPKDTLTDSFEDLLALDNLLVDGNHTFGVLSIMTGVTSKIGADKMDVFR